MASSFKCEGSAKTFLHVCDICLEDNRNVEAVAFCAMCDQRLCVTCKTVHERSKASRSHMLIYGDNLNTETVSNKLLCQTHDPNQEVTYYCLSHEVPCCEKCKLVDHRGCKHIESLRKVAAMRKPKEEGHKLLQKSQFLEAEIESLKSKFKTNLNTLNEQQDSMIETIHDQRRLLDTVLDEWETTSVKEVKDTITKESRVINDNVSICSDLSPEVRTNIQKIQQALKKSDEQCFIEMTEIQKNKSKYNDLFHKIPKVSCKIDLTYEIENTTETIKSLLKGSHKIDVRYSKDRNSLPSLSKRHYKDRVAIDAGEINISLESDVETPGITGIEVMHEHGNDILFCDGYNRKLKLLSIGNNSWTENALSSDPWRMCKTDAPNEVIVTLPDEKCLQLFVINKTGEIVTDDKNETNHTDVRLISKHRHSHITLACQVSGWIIDVTGKKGNLLRNIRNESHPSKLLELPTYQTVSSCGTIYTTDRTYGCIGISMTGAVVFRYNDELVKECVGVTTDPDGNVYLSGAESNNVVMVNSKGEAIKVLLDGLENPRYIKYDEPTNTLFVYLMGSQVVKKFYLL